MFHPVNHVVDLRDERACDVVHHQLLINNDAHPQHAASRRWGLCFAACMGAAVLARACSICMHAEQLNKSQEEPRAGGSISSGASCKPNMHMHLGTEPLCIELVPGRRITSASSSAKDDSGHKHASSSRPSVLARRNTP